MILQKRLMICASALGLVAGTAIPAAAAPWVRGYVVGSYEYAFRYGGRQDYVRAGEIEPGIDCRHGSTLHFSTSARTNAALMQPWRTETEIHNIVEPPGLETARNYQLTRFNVWNRAVAYRGFRKGIETYVNPFAAADPGQPEVTGRIGIGFDLDNDPHTGNFVNEEGQKGIDNALYRAWGCDAPWRGDGNATLHMRANGMMREGLYTMVIRISGNQDPTNDSDATLEIGYSPDKIVRDAGGNLATSYSYRIAKNEQYSSKLKAKIRDGVVETEQVSELHAPRIAWFYDQTGDADFHQGRVRLVMGADGSATGLIGGYRNWRDLYAENTFAQDGGQQGLREHEDHISLYYALKRNADGMTNPKTGKNMGISTAYRIKAVRAYVVDPDRPVGFTKLAVEEPRKRAFQAIRDAFTVASITRIIQDVPPGTSEAAPRLDKKGADIDIFNLPNGGYLQRILDRPHYSVSVDENGNVVLPPSASSSIGDDRIGLAGPNTATSWVVP